MHPAGADLQALRRAPAFLTREMASLYKRPGSGYWWLKSKNQKGEIDRSSTKLRIDSPCETRKAQALMHERTAQELRHAQSLEVGPWDSWVDDWLSLRYCESPRTLKRYRGDFQEIRRFLDLKGIRTPAGLTYENCITYIAWRTKPDLKNGNYGASQSTALHELRVLGVIMHEAMRRGYVSTNPCWKLGFSRTPMSEKPEIPDEHLAIIGDELKHQAEWERLSFKVGLETGLRISETRLYMPDVDLEKRTITIGNPKGGRKRGFSIPFDDVLAPLLTKAKREQPNGFLFDWPDYKGGHTKLWWKFFRNVAKKHGIPHYCFHCTRVTFITRGARNGVPERVMMKLVNHANTTIHRIYLRLNIDDTRDYLPLVHSKVKV